MSWKLHPFNVIRRTETISLFFVFFLTKSMPKEMLRKKKQLGNHVNCEKRVDLCLP